MRAVLLGLVVFALGLAAAALVASPRAGAHATDGTLSASVGPGFTISMSASSVTAGSYTIDVSDSSSIHNFHLSGPGVNKKTSISGTGSESWSVTLQPGTYSFQCDAHASTMNGTLTVTSAETTSTAPTTAEHTTTEQTTSEAETTTESQTTTEAETTTGAETTPDATTTSQPETTLVIAPPPPPLHARITFAHASGRSVTLHVASSRPGRATAALMAGTHRLAHAAGKAPGRLVLRATHALRPGRYTVRVRVTAADRSATASRSLRVG